MPPLRTIVLGMRGAFTGEALGVLLEANCGISGLVVAGADLKTPGRDPDAPHGAGWRRLEPRRVLAADPPTAVERAWGAGLPVIEVGWVDARALAALDALEPDLVAIACFPWLLPKPWRARPPRGCVNIHPSLLPAYRGPTPLFWQFHAGETRTGVTLHAVDGGEDTGGLIAQQAVAFPDGIDTRRAEELTAAAGARLLAEWLASGKTVGPAQPVEGASRQPAPDAAARVIPASWPIRRAFNFLRGAEAWGPFEIDTGRVRIAVHHAIAMDEAASLGSTHRAIGHDLLVQFSGGVLLAR
jgi:methionyl-tRNA formyltransferase